MDRNTPKAFSELKKKLLTSIPTLIYPDPNKPYFLFTDASKYFWGASLCQHICDHKIL